MHITVGERIYRAGAAENRRQILELVPHRPDGNLLDLGCGDGRFTVEVSARAGASQAFGIELLHHLADQAEWRGIDVKRANLAEPWPFDSGSMHIVHSNQVIEHLSFTDHFLREIRRVLRPDGVAIVSTNNLASWHNVLSLVLGWQPPPCHPSDEIMAGNPASFVDGRDGVLGQTHLRIFTSRALAEVAYHHGLQLDVDRGAGYYPLPPLLARTAASADRRHAAFLVQRYVASESRP